MGLGGRIMICCSSKLGMERSNLCIRKISTTDQGIYIIRYIV